MREIVHELVGGQVALAMAIVDAQAEVATRLGAFLDDPKSLLILSKVLKELTVLSNSVGRRIEGSLVVASTLRAQRRLWRLQDSRGHR